MDIKKAFELLNDQFEQEKDSQYFPTSIFSAAGELSPTLVGEYLIDVCGFEEEEAYDVAIDWIDSDELYKQHCY